MGLLDSFRQLYLLLWKNFILRSRRKLRVTVEIIWPLFLFLILMWVRTRGLTFYEKQCHYTERPLPSSGAIPFLRGFICELNNSCSHQPRDSYYGDDLLELTDLSSNLLAVVSQPEFVANAQNLVNYGQTLISKRAEASAITSAIKLSEVLIDGESVFTQRLSNMGIYPSPIDSMNLTSILNSNPNFNNLYSNYSNNYSEPLLEISDNLANVPLFALNFLYGSDLERVDLNRASNRVYDAKWIRAQMCDGNTNYLLKGDDEMGLADFLCSNEFNSTQLENLFILISTQLDVTTAKNRVYNVFSSDFFFIRGSLNAVQSFRNLQAILSNANILQQGDLQSLQELYNRITNLNLEESICKGSQLSIFTIVNGLRFININPQRLKELTDDMKNSTRIDHVMEVFRNLSINNVEEPEARQYRFRNNRYSKPRLEKEFVHTERVNTARADTNSDSFLSDQLTVQALKNLLVRLNYLKSVSKEDCPIQRYSSDQDPATQVLINSTTKSCFCQQIYSIISQSSQSADTLFSYLKPMFLGKVLYSPNTPAYQNLIKRVNKTFESVEEFNLIVKQISVVVGDLAIEVSKTENQQQINSVIETINTVSAQLNQTFKIDPVNYNLLNVQLEFFSELILFIHNSIYCIELNKFIGYETEREAVDIGVKLIDKEAFWAAIIFQNPEIDANTLPKIVNYKLRMNSSQVHNTIFTQDRFYRFDPSDCLGCNVYFTYGFIYLQDMFEKSIIEMKTNQTQNFGLAAQMTPYPCYVDDRFVRAISRSLPLFMVLAWIYTVSMIVKDIVYEKEKRLKEFMRVMGLSNATHWLAWFITSFVVMFFVAFLLCIILRYGKITQYSDVTVLIVFMTCFTIATISQCFLISVFFNKANLAAVVAGIIYFILYLPYTILINYSDVILPWQKFLASLSSTVAFSYGCEIIATFELQTLGVQWSNFYQSPFSRYDGFSMNVICLILLLDSFIYMVLTWYIEAVFPGEFGVPRAWYFLFDPYYWLGSYAQKFLPKKEQSKTSAESSNAISKFFRKIFIDQKQKIIREEEERQQRAEFNNGRLSSLENNDLSDLKAGIEIKQLHKVYSRGNNHALKGLSLSFYENEITAFLGHNGAGKSTTMHLLTGLYSPTAGSATINGLDISNSMFNIRKSLGFVPQHNVLFPELTVGEHLWFYARLKGLSRELTIKELNKMLDDTGLRPKKSDFSKDLSGGMQRKLSVAIAFSGGSKTVILDEPSAGVDPSGRRSIWDLLFKFRIGRTIVVSTHHMDEADVLGDRIAIISNGRLIAHGTSYFLKRKYGRGYYLTIAKKQQNTYEQGSGSSISGSDKATSSLTASRTSTDSGLPAYNDLNPDLIDDSLIQVEEREKEKARIENAKVVDYFDTNNGEDDDNDIEVAQRKKEKRVLASLTTAQDIRINEFIKKRIENAILIENIGLEMTFSISNQIEYTKGYEKFFREIEANEERLGIDSIGISDTTLEEIFIKLAKEPHKDNFKKREYRLCGVDFTGIFDKIKCACCKDEPVKKLTNEELTEYSKLTNNKIESRFKLNNKQLGALLLKRFHRVKRNVKGFFAEIVMPVVFVCLALLVATLTPKTTDRPALELHPWYYQTPNQVFYSKSSSLKYDIPKYSVTGTTSTVDSSEQANIEKVDKIIGTFFQRSSIGTRCMEGWRIRITPQAEDYRRAQLGSELPCESYAYDLESARSTPSLRYITELNMANYSYTKTSLECDCANGFPKCPESAGGDINFREVVKLRTRDNLYDLTSRNISDWLIKTEFDDQFFRKRFGGFEFIKTTEVNSTTVDNVELGINTLLGLTNATAGITFNADNFISKENIKIWYNVKGYDASVGYLNVLNNAILRSQLNASEVNVGEHGIVAFNHPMNLTRVQFFNEIENRIVIDLFVAIFIIFALSLIPASFLVFLLEERETHSKQLQFVSGVKPYMYWISNFVWDLMNYLVPCVLCIFLFLIFNVKAYISKENFPCLVTLMLLYGWACIPLMYPLNYLFKIPSTAFVVSSSLNVFIGIVSVMSTTILDQLGEDDKDLADVNYYLKPIFVVLFPHYCLGRGFLDMAVLYNTAAAKRAFGQDETFDPFLFDNVGKNLLALTIQGFLFFTLNMLIEYKFFIRFKPTDDPKKLNLPKYEDEDDDVARERERILNKEMAIKLKKKEVKQRRNRLKSPKTKFKNVIDEKSNESSDLQESYDRDYIKLINLTKIYRKFKKFKFKKHVAVNSLSIGIDKGECFGLIGVNGAGKTTTFKMITGDIPITGGDVKVNGFSVSKQIEKVHRSIGYCPQFDALMPLLTCREHLMFFSRLRGIPEKHVKNVSIWAMNKVGLNVFADRIAGDLSGGNKRKLSTAIALVGNPSVVCLDEPTSGMDAKARRLLWNDILNLTRENRIVILTSHSMEECEALCTRLVIMVNGQFKCLGSPQHIKVKFGNGYKLAIRLNKEENKDKLYEFISKSFPTSQIGETHKNLFEFVLPFKDTKLSKVFGRIENNRDYLELKDYSVSQSTLDQIFVNFAKNQYEENFIDMSDLKKSKKEEFIDAFKSPVATLKGKANTKYEASVKSNDFQLKTMPVVDDDLSYQDLRENDFQLKTMPVVDDDLSYQDLRENDKIENNQARRETDLNNNEFNEENEKPSGKIQNIAVKPIDLNNSHEEIFEGISPLDMTKF